MNPNKVGQLIAGVGVGLCGLAALSRVDATPYFFGKIN
jgi:hypothetical protein